MTENGYVLGINEIKNFLPHAYPFLLIDRVIEISEPPTDRPGPENGLDIRVGSKVVALKNVTYNEPYFTGHFPNYAIVPGVLWVETMAQASCFAVYPALMKQPESVRKNLRCILLGVDNARFRKPVTPGDSLIIQSELTKTRGKMIAFSCTALVNGQKVAEAELLTNIIAGTEN